MMIMGTEYAVTVIVFIINLHVQNTCQLLHGITNMDLLQPNEVSMRSYTFNA